MERGGIETTSLPCEGHEVEMVVFLPNAAGLPKFEEKITAAALTNWLDDLARPCAWETVQNGSQLDDKQYWCTDMADD